MFFSTVAARQYTEIMSQEAHKFCYVHLWQLKMRWQVQFDGGRLKRLSCKIFNFDILIKTSPEKSKFLITCMFIAWELKISVNHLIILWPPKSHIAIESKAAPEWITLIDCSCFYSDCIFYIVNFVHCVSVLCFIHRNVLQNVQMNQKVNTVIPQRKAVTWNVVQVHFLYCLHSFFWGGLCFSGNFASLISGFRVGKFIFGHLGAVEENSEEALSW